MSARTKWIEISGSVHPSFAWGGSFRESGLALVNDSSNPIKGLSLIAIGQKDLGEFAHTHWGKVPARAELAAAFGEESARLLDAYNAPEWARHFEDSFEEMRKRACQDELGLVAVTHSCGGNEAQAESALFGTTLELASFALTAMSENFYRRAGIELPAAKLDLQTAAA